MACRPADAMPREPSARQPLCADIDGSSLHAAVRVQAHDRKRQEQLCRYITRPALSDERVQLNAAGQVELKLKTPWRHLAPARASGRWLARWAPEVVSPHGLKPRAALQSLRVPPACGCLPLRGLVRVIGLQLLWDASKLPVATVG
jgi:hypothetical protein